MKVYVAASSKEIDRAVRQMDRLRRDDIEVVSTWAENIKKVGQANPEGRSREDYVKWTKQNLSELRRADVLWLLIPEAQTIGAWVELGYAEASGKLICGSGIHKPIHTNALCRYHSEYDAEIGDFLKRLSKSGFTDGPNTADQLFEDRARGNWAHDGT